MRFPISMALSSLLLLLCFQPLQAEVNYLPGPLTGKLGDMAEIKVPEGYKFVEKKDMKEFDEQNHNLYGENELGLLLNPNHDSGYAVFFSFEDIGYIKDADKEVLDADKLWSTLKENQEEANKARKEKGWPEMELVRWEEKPQYNPQTQRLEWAIVFKEKDKEFINYSTRILGRKGVMEAVLVPMGELSSAIPQFNQVMAGYDFSSGNKYAEWTTGDKVAEFGLAALVVGGAGALAAKSGLFAKLFALIAAAGVKLWAILVAAFAAVVNFVKKLFGGKRDDGNPPSVVK